jgi:hypothetical protein
MQGLLPAQQSLPSEPQTVWQVVPTHFSFEPQGFTSVGWQLPLLWQWPSMTPLAEHDCGAQMLPVVAVQEPA